MRQFLDILLDGSSILSKVRSVRVERRRDQSMDTVTLELADYSLYAQFDFGTVPTTERIQVATANGDPKTDGSTSGTNVLTSASSGFIAAGVTTDDLLMILASTVGADVGTWPITAVAATQLTSSHAFGSATGIQFVVLKNQGRFFVEKPDVLEDKNQLTIPSLWGRCGLARLNDPFAGKITRSYSAMTSFYEVVRDLVKLCGMDSTKIQFDIDDYAIPANIYSVSSQYPLQVIIDLSAKSNGYVKCKKDGNLWVLKDVFHFGSLPVAQALGDNDINEVRESLEYPQFGNRILVHTSFSSGGLEYQVRLELDTACVRGNGTAQAAARAIVTDGAGTPVPDGTPVEWTIDDASLAEWFPKISSTGEMSRISEVQTANDPLGVRTDYPIREVLGVYLENDGNKADNFFIGGEFKASDIALGKELPFSDSRVVIDYIAAGIARSTLESKAGAPEAKTFVHAAVGKIRDTQEFCINNQRNVAISINASKTSYNLCANEQAMISKITAQVKIDGLPANGAVVNWKRIGEANGQLSPKFSVIKTLPLQEVTTSRNNFTVSVQNEISKVIGVWLGATVGFGTDYFNSQQNRKASFEGRDITLGTNLPQSSITVVVQYLAPATVEATYTLPQQIGRDTIIATLPDGTSTPETASVDIEAVSNCTGDSSAPRSDPGGEKDCSKSTASASSCAQSSYPNIFFPTREDCICAKEGASGGCPKDEQGCEDLCKQMYQRCSCNPLDCDVKPDPDRVLALEQQLDTVIPLGQEVPYDQCAKECNGDPDCVEECVANHKDATIDRCKKKCIDHGLQISPRTATIQCSGAKSVDFTVTGGKGPYSWISSKGTLVTSGDKNEKATLKPSDNSGSAVSGLAYRIGKWHRCNGGFNAMDTISYGCNDQVLDACTKRVANGNSYNPATCGFCGDGSPDCGSNIGALTPIVDDDPQFGTGAACLAARPCDADGALCDARTPSMLSQGCNPCRLSMNGTTLVTVTSADGKAATAIVTGGN